MFVKSSSMILDQCAGVVESKDKKKKRRSNRKNKQIPSVSGSTVNEICMESLHPLNNASSNEQRLPKASNVSFISLPTMHIDGQLVLQKGGTVPSQHLSPSDYGGRMFPRSCPEPIACDESMVGSNVRNDFYSTRETECHVRRKYFASYWNAEAVTAALEKGDAFTATFRVNAHNRLEAYCKVDGVPTDILINGLCAQNRAVEGDIVVIKVDPLSLWTKMKGSIGAPSNAAVMDDCNLVPRATDPVGDNCKGKGKVDIDCENGNCRNLPENKFHDERSTYHGENGSPEPVALVRNSNSLLGCSSEHDDIVTAAQKLCAMTSANPLKRPTGKVVAIIERSRRRDAVVGFLNVKSWPFSKEGYKYDSQTIEQPLLSSYREYVLFIPTDSKFPKMMVPIRTLPDCIKKRLEVNDATVETELVAAQIVDWVEENNAPEAHIIRVFGRGGDIEPHIAAILFENAIRSCEFSSETLSCLPSVTWVVPVEEYQTRRDIRHLCVFTIDPATASDLDDALSVEWLPNGIYRVGVHIADASYFVLPATALDAEAQIRATSVYLLQRKVPMLPSLLSENLGSLTPGEERLAFSIFWDINLSGEVLDCCIVRTIIRSCCKLSYEHAQDIIDGKFDVESCTTLENGLPHLHGQFEWSNVVKSVKSLHAISKILKAKRFDGGALSLNNRKLVFLFDEDGNPYDCVFYGSKDSNFLVEELMLLANRTVAEVITRAYPSTALLRRHPEPNLRKLRELEAFCSKNGLDLDTSSSGHLHLSLERIKKELKDDSVLYDILQLYATRPMQLAAYFCSGNLEDGEQDWGHYSLAVPLYTHFTCPLRRYADIIVHRTLAAAVEAEATYMKLKNKLLKSNEERSRRCFTGVYFDKDAVETPEAQQALLAAASKHSVPCRDILAGVAAHCNERKLASRHVKDATDKLYMWVLLKKKEVLLSEARVVGLGPRFMSIYIQKLAMERRIYYDEVEGLTAEWLDATCTLVLGLCTKKRFQRRGSPVKCRPLEDAVLIVSPYSLIRSTDSSGGNSNEVVTSQIEEGDTLARAAHTPDVEPNVFPLTIRILSTISVALHAVGGNDGPQDIGARLFVSSYLSG